jgi:hypothetical protein
MKTMSSPAAGLALFLVLALGLCRPALGAVRVVVGPTTIQGGDAQAANDITVSNDKLAFAIAVGSPVPYGVPRGAIVDVAPVADGQVGRDHAVFADFIPNNWSAWPNTYQHVDILERGPQRVVVRAVRDWGQATIATVYTLRDGADAVEIRTTMTNNGQAALSGLLSGLTLWPKGGFLFAVPGLAGVESGKADAALASRVVAYDEDWSITLHAPYFDHVGYGSKDMYLLHSLAPGESRTFDGRLQVGSRGDLAPVIGEEIAHAQTPSGHVHGWVRDRAGRRVSKPVVVILKAGKPYGWALGHDGAYDLALQPGDYSLYATAKAYSQSAAIPLTVAAGVDLARDFTDLEPPGAVRFVVSDEAGGKAVDARIAITEGQKPLVQFLGKKTFFTALDPKGEAKLDLAPGDYLFTVSSGGGFLGESRQLRLRVGAGQTQTAKVALLRRFDPTARGWYAADLHHHADQAEAVTPAADLARSQLAAGLDLLFVSDHDSTVNHAPLQAIADRRGVAFIPSLELSASWGHFNAYPLTPGQALAIDTGTATIDQMLGEARRQGALVVQANHPFIPYGYLASLAAGVAPGGFNPGFDLLEINAAAPGDDAKVLGALHGFWDGGHRYYLSGGTDTHDVWNDVSGRLRTFVHVDGPVTALAFAEALKAGHAYVSYGPLIYPSVMFGDTVKTRPGEPVSLGFDLESVEGLKTAQLVGGGVKADMRAFAYAPRAAHVDFQLSREHAGWVALVVEDQRGRKAYTDPIWIDPVTPPTAGSR